MSNAKAENREMTRQVRKEMSRFALDTGDVQIGMSHGNITFHGRIRAMKGHEESFETSVAAMVKAIRAMRGIRDVLPEWTLVH